MLSVLLFFGIYSVIEGLIYILDTVLWKKEAGENFLEYGMYYAQTRHDFYKQELGYAGFMIILGIILLLISLWLKKKKK